MSDMDINSKGGDSDLGGDPNKTPTEAGKTQADRLTDEKIRKQRIGRSFSIALVGSMLIMAVFCCLFALYTGYHFLETLDNSKEKSDLENAIALVQKMAEKKCEASCAACIDTNTCPQKNIEQTKTEEVKASTFAALIPATFSSALAIILFITLARFVTNFGLSEKDEEKKQQDYGAISALVQEVVTVFKSFSEKSK